MILLLMVWPFLTLPCAAADTIGFDDVGLWLHNLPIFSGYAGLEWDGFFAMHVPSEFGSNDPTGYVAGMVTPECIAYNYLGEPAEIRSDAPFTLVSAWLTAAWLDDLQITVEGFSGSSLIYAQTVAVSPTAATLFNFNYVGVDRVRFTSSGGMLLSQNTGDGPQFVMDNLVVGDGTFLETLVTIDIKPGNPENPINTRSNGVIPVAILSLGEFNAPVQVDYNSLKFGPNGTELRLVSANPKDVNGDGRPDLICHFFIEEGTFNCDNVKGILTGETRGKVKITGEDAVRVVPCK